MSIHNERLDIIGALIEHGYTRPNAEELLERVTKTDRERALEVAMSAVDKLAAPALKPNGYVIDGWRPSTLAERTGEILNVARFLMGEVDE